MIDRITAIIEALEEKPEHGLELLDGLLFSFIAHIKMPISAVTNPALGAFIALQDDFQYNVAQHLVQLYHTENVAILTVNRLMQGLLLVHPKSRAIFRHGRHMRALLRLLDTTTSTEEAVSLISTVIHVLLKDLDNFRVFEREGGCACVINKMKAEEDKLNYKVIEFLIFYLVDEGEGKGTRTVKEKSDFFRDVFPEIEELVGVWRSIGNNEARET